MHKRSSFTSSSDSVVEGLVPAHTWPRDRGRLVWVVVATVLWLVAIEVVVSVTFAYPDASPKATAGPGMMGTLRRYFEYGRSIEGKLRRRTGPTDDETHLSMLPGWPPNEAQLAELPRRAAQPDGILVAGYGMSFGEHVLDAVAEIDPRIVTRQLGGPGSTLGHSYYNYLLDRGRHEADVVVLSVLASSFPSFDTMTHMTWNFENPSPHMYPRFVLENGELARIDPPISTMAELRAALADPARWREVTSALAEHDAFYDTFVFDAGPADASSLARSLRRSWGQRQSRATRARFYGPAGFTNVSGAVDTARVILERFAAQVREDGKRPVVLLFNDRGYADDLYRALAPTLDAHDIPYVSTHTMAPASNLANFIADGHFTPENDVLFARAFLDLLK